MEIGLIRTSSRSSNLVGPAILALEPVQVLAPTVPVPTVQAVRIHVADDLTFSRDLRALVAVVLRVPASVPMAPAVDRVVVPAAVLVVLVVLVLVLVLGVQALIIKGMRAAKVDVDKGRRWLLLKDAPGVPIADLMVVVRMLRVPAVEVLKGLGLMGEVRKAEVRAGCSMVEAQMRTVPKATVLKGTVLKATVLKGTVLKATVHRDTVHRATIPKGMAKPNIACRGWNTRPRRSCEKYVTYELSLVVGTKGMVPRMWRHATSNHLDPMLVRLDAISKEALIGGALTEGDLNDRNSDRRVTDRIEAPMLDRKVRSAARQDGPPMVRPTSIVA